MTYRNQHLSFSRLSRFEQCPLSFKLHYIDQIPANPSPPLVFGKAVHAVLEKLLWEHCLEGKVGPLSTGRAVELWQEESQADGMASGGIARFQEGVELLSAFVRQQGVVDPASILGVEQEFSFPVGPFTVVGFIDRVERLDEHTIRIVDYKTNQQLFSREEVEGSLQLSLYQLAARQLWPWAKHVRLSYHMLRHGLSQDTERTEAQLEAVVKYVETVGRSTEEAREFLPRLNPFCPSCDHRGQCPEFQRALQGEQTFVCENLSDLESVVREREEVARLAKILNSRKDELDRVLRNHLRDRAELLVFGLVIGLAAGIFEELGWTGFAIPRLRLRHNVLATGLIVGSLWAAWHLLVNFWGSGSPSGELSLALLLHSLLFSVGILPAFRVLIVWVHDRTGSLLAAMLMHASLTTSNVVLVPSATGVPLVVWSLVLAVAFWIVVAVVSMARGGLRACVE